MITSFEKHAFKTLTNLVISHGRHEHVFPKRDDRGNYMISEWIK